MTAVYLIRHPQTTWNVESRYQGRLDAPLSPQGRREARLLAAALKNHRFDAIYTSPLQRAQALASEVAEASGSPVEVDERLTEIAMGPWEGLYRQEIEDAYPELYSRWYTDPESVRFPGAESLEDVMSRTCSSMADIFAGHPAAHIAVVSHSAVIRVLVIAALGLGLRSFHMLHMSNAGITTICGTEAPGRLLTLNSLESVYGSPVQSALAHDCVSWKQWRPTL